MADRKTSPQSETQSETQSKSDLLMSTATRAVNEQSQVGIVNSPAWQKAWKSSTNHPSLLGIPLEIRLMIYAYLFTAKYFKVSQDRDDFRLAHTTVEDGIIAWGLLRACKTTAREVKPLINLKHIFLEVAIMYNVGLIDWSYLLEIQTVIITHNALINTPLSSWTTMRGLRYVEVLHEEQDYEMPLPQQLLLSSTVQDLRLFVLPWIRLECIHLQSETFRSSPYTSRRIDHEQFQDLFHRQLFEADIEIRYRFRFRPSREALTICAAKSTALPIFDMVLDMNGKVLERSVRSAMLTETGAEQVNWHELVTDVLDMGWFDNEDQLFSQLEAASRSTSGGM